MATAQVKTENDQKKLIAAVALGVVALIGLWWAFFGFGGSSTTPQKNPGPVVRAASPTTPGRPKPDDKSEAVSNLSDLSVIDASFRQPTVSETGRNIFAFYEPPPVVVKPSPVIIPTPSPPPPVLLASVSPSNVYARTDDFTLDITGDKFTPAVRVLIDGRQLPTRYVSPQQLAATVSAAIIATPGQRRVEVKSDDGKLYSNQAILAIAAPPVPNFTYVGSILKRQHIGDTAFLQDKGSKEIVSVQRGDILGGRFRVSSISDRELVVIDTTLKIKHTLALTNDNDKGATPAGRPTPKVQSEDDEP